MLSKPNRLTQKTGFDRVFERSKPLRHELCTLRACHNGLDVSRFGFICAKTVGNAVKRNRVRRQLRHQARALLPEVGGCWDILVIARPKAVEASSAQLYGAIHEMLKRRGVLGGNPEE